MADEGAAEGDRIANQSIRVNVDTLEHLMTMVSELVLTRNQLLEISRRNEDTEFKVPLQRLSNVTAELQEGVMKTRMQPIGNAWQKLPRIVRDLSSELGKQIELEMHGADTELDRQVLDLIKDPLTHMVRNSADHGLETPAERLASGKGEQGTIRLSAYHEGGHIIICIADNGRGLNTERIKAKAISSGLVTEAELEKMSEAQIHKFIFAPGFSTAAAITSVSGRGVGMDVVRTNIDQIGGTIDIKSVAGEGSSVTIKIPLTLAIVSALIVEAAGDRFAIPQLSVVELVRARANSEHRIERIKDTAVLRLRNKLLPLIHLKKLLKIDDGAASDPENGFIVVTQVGSQTFGIVVDGVFHTEEIVVKPMSTKLRHIDMFSGNTILGDGAVIMIIDPNGIAKALGAAGSSAHDMGDENGRDHRHRRGTAQHRGRRLRLRHSRFGRDQGPGHRGDRRRPLPADGVRRLVHPQGDEAVAALAVGVAGRRLGLLPQHAGPRAEGGRLPRPHRADRAGGPGCTACAELRRGPDRHRDARHERVRVRRSDPLRHQSGRDADHRPVRAGVAGGDRARPSGRLPRLCRQVRPSRSDRGAEGTDRGRRRRLRAEPGSGVTALGIRRYRYEQQEDADRRRRHGRIRHRDDRRPAVRPADLPRPGRVHARARHPRSLVLARDRGRAEPARPHRHRGRHARPARPAQARGRQDPDGGRRRPAR
ncbi:Signal transduction histidine kinase CheA EC 273 CDS [Bradyrhizobium sp. G22]|nr:Signal transduction histidine kinase CheA EC 273 CDS [Bradyrhizobium sp. G22]